MCQRVEWHFGKVVRESLTEKAASEQRLRGESSSAGTWGKSITSREKSKGKPEVGIYLLCMRNRKEGSRGRAGRREGQRKDGGGEE